ncbi:MAG TPA: 50S ribosomal protein L13 [Chitinophagales bacterium]|nr:50S ribosomal protein L13 [Chitinophagales bacterium]HRK26298.1 50S ribosomal protein L13 [Chitinophagales bacterium]
MDTLSYKTPSVSKKDVTHDWYVIDAQNMVVGRLATAIVTLLRGKNKVWYSPNMDCGDYVIVINADKIRFTGNKMSDKVYVHHTGYPGGQRFTTPAELMAKHPERILEKAVKGMLPKNRLGRQVYGKLFVYSGAEHPHKAQQPQKLEL